MSSAAATLDPTEAISAAVRELYEQLRDIVDRGPTDDPGLLDEIGKLTGKIRSRITRARKRARSTDNAASGATSGNTPASADPAKPATAAPSVPPKAVAPATTATPSERVSVRLTESGNVRDVPNVSPVAKQERSSETGGPTPLSPWWAHRPQILVVAVILLVAAAIVVTGNPLVVLGGAAVAEVMRVGVLRLVRWIRSGGAR